MQSCVMLVMFTKKHKQTRTQSMHVVSDIFHGWNSFSDTFPLQNKWIFSKVRCDYSNINMELTEVILLCLGLNRILAWIVKCDSRGCHRRHCDCAPSPCSASPASPSCTPRSSAGSDTTCWRAAPPPSCLPCLSWMFALQMEQTWNLGMKTTKVKGRFKQMI